MNTDHVTKIIFVTETSRQSHLYHLLSSDVTPQCLTPVKMADEIWRLAFPMHTPNHLTFIINSDELDKSEGFEDNTFVLTNNRTEEKFSGNIYEHFIVV